jgi:hypothetical protein
MRRALSLCLSLFAVAVPSAQACDCGGCPPTSCGTTSSAAPGSGLLSVRTAGQRGPLQAYDVRSGRRRFALPPGILSADGRLYVSVRTVPRHGSVVRLYDAHTGRPVGGFRYDRKGYFLGGVSPNGRWLALIHQAPHRTRIELVDAQGRERYALRLHGWYDVDAVSNAARRVFLIQYVRSGYLIRRYDAVRRRLASGSLTEKGVPMNGTAWDAVASPDGRRLMTLYLRGNGPEVHALDLVRGTAVCIDLPRGDQWSVQQYTLALSPDGGTLYASNPALGVVATVDLAKKRVVKLVRFLRDPESAALAPSAVTSHDGRTVYFTAGRSLFAYDVAYGRVRGPYDPGAGIAGIAFGRIDRTLLVVTRNGRALRLDAATGRVLR